MPGLHLADVAPPREHDPGLVSGLQMGPRAGTASRRAAGSANFLLRTRAHGVPSQPQVPPVTQPATSASGRHASASSIT